MKKIFKALVSFALLGSIFSTNISAFGENISEQERIDDMLNTISIISFGEEMPTREKMFTDTMSIEEIKVIIKSDLEYFISGKNEGKKYFWTPEYIDIVEREFPELLSDILRQTNNSKMRSANGNEVVIASDYIEPPISRASGSRSANHEIQYYSANWYLHVTSKFSWSWNGSNITIGSRTYSQYNDSTPAFANISVYENGTTSPKIDYIYHFTGDAIFEGRQCYIVQYSPSTTGAYGVNVIYKN